MLFKDKLFALFAGEGATTEFIRMYMDTAAKVWEACPGPEDANLGDKCAIVFVTGKAVHSIVKVLLADCIFGALALDVLDDICKLEVEASRTDGVLTPLALFCARGKDKHHLDEQG